MTSFATYRLFNLLFYSYIIIQNNFPCLQFKRHVFFSSQLLKTDVFEGSGWTDKVLMKNQTVKIFGSEKMQWRGEAFLISGT